MLHEEALFLESKDVMIKKVEGGIKNICDMIEKDMLTIIPRDTEGFCL